MTRTIYTTSNGHTVEVRDMGHATKVVSAGFIATYTDHEFARYIAAVRFVWLSVGCYACALDTCGRRVADNAPHTH